VKLKLVFSPLLALTVAACNNNENVTTTPAATVRLAQTNLVSDQAGVGAHTDPALINAWGLAIGPTGIAWVNANGSGSTQLYDSTGAPNASLPSVKIPAPAGATGPSAPTGQVFNGDATQFKGDLFISSTEDGTISGWKVADGTTAVLEVDNSAGTDHPVYKGIALGTSSSGGVLFAADFHNAKIDVFDGNFAAVTMPAGSFVDPNLPAGFAPFNLKVIGTKLYVTYAKQNAEKHDDVAGVGNGFVDTFNLDGTGAFRLISTGTLNSPWGMAIAPNVYAAAPNALIIGNFGDGTMAAYDPVTGVRVASIINSSSTPLVIDGLWALQFGGGLSGEANNQLFFTAGPAAETHGLFGVLNLSATQ
jgi:uncharacterized protein (TIGR03118 family)